MLGIERQHKIIDRLRQDRKVYVTELSKEFGVTPETVRRDLERLENEGILRRSYGGAVPAQPINEDLPFNSRAAANYEEKQAIAFKAARLVNNGYSLMADSSTTVLALIDSLRTRTDLTIITNSVKLLNDYAGSGFTLIGTGGSLRSHSFALVGAAACRALESFNVDLALLSCKGLDREKGVMESNEPEALVKQLMAKRAKTRILLADHTKFDQIVFMHTLDYTDLDYVVTDCEPKRAWISFLKEKGVQLIY
ncbi:MAG: DeoR/GlpR family DNA-binding transcription regulator [Candidatus Accumulibacter sp.]|jgi:DeoR/GlpR family transcriptional regulator of sugar metabolism|nr:DeoR/GlpR family DNA-binding transcription regulator [Accumulibacter sp.]